MEIYGLDQKVPYFYKDRTAHALSMDTGYRCIKIKPLWSGHAKICLTSWSALRKEIMIHKTEYRYNSMYRYFLSIPARTLPDLVRSLLLRQVPLLPHILQHLQCLVLCCQPLLPLHLCKHARILRKPELQCCRLAFWCPKSGWRSCTVSWLQKEEKRMNCSTSLHVTKILLFGDKVVLKKIFEDKYL